MFGEGALHSSATKRQRGVELPGVACSRAG
jgi:hypothetical protein